VKICEPYLPKSVFEGNRNSRMFIVLSQIAVLNPKLKYDDMIAMANIFNKKLIPQLRGNELSILVTGILKMRKEQNLYMNYNKERRFIFNPKYNIPHKDKMKIVNHCIGESRKQATQQKIYNEIEDRKFEDFGPITQSKIADLTGLASSTVKKHWSIFKGLSDEINNNFKNKKSLDYSRLSHFI